LSGIKPVLTDYWPRLRLMYCWPFFTVILPCLCWKGTLNSNQLT